ncbi:RtcB family protein, partial [Bacillus sp. TSA_125.2]
MVHTFRKLGGKYDIGCGMEVVIINKKKEEINFDYLDETIR